ncbi:hypothetical protein [Streptomyces olivaceus]|uniref:hypothetical protein n=1 Tax=Streptomyces olivaceus TaxID=47716 RepID=UPI00362AEA01
MQRPTRRQTTAALSVPAGGAVATVVVYRDSLDPVLVDLASSLLSMACATTVLLSVMRRWLTQHEARTTEAVNRLLHQQQIQEEELLARERAVQQAERHVERTAHLTSFRVRSAWKRVDILYGDNAALRSRCEQLESDFDELTTEYNELVGETLRSRAAVFTQRTTGTSVLIRGGDDEEHSRADAPLPGLATRSATRGDAVLLPGPARRRDTPSLGLVRQLGEGGKARQV